MPTLTVTLSDAALARIGELAAERNTTPEALAAADLERPDVGRPIDWAAVFATERPPAAGHHLGRNGRAAEPPADPADDPLLALLGSITCDVTDVSERHDEYIGQGLYDEIRAGEQSPRA